jgi:hypothetical protein
MMIIAALASAFMFQVAAISTDTVPVDTAAVYSAILTDLRIDYPEEAIALAENRADEHCMFVCPDRQNQPRHSTEVLSALHERRVVNFTCQTTPGILGCHGLPNGAVLVALGPVQTRLLQYGENYRRPEFSTWPQTPNDVWVFASFYVMESNRHPVPQSYAYRFLLRKNDSGEWRVMHMIFMWHNDIR